MYITISKRFQTVDKQVKSNSPEQLFLEVYYYQRIASHVYTRNITYRIKIFGSFHIRLTVDVTDLNTIIFFGSLLTINRHVFFCLAKKKFFTSIRFFEFSKK